MSNFLKILSELNEVVSKINYQEVAKLIEYLNYSNHIFITGAGRSGLMIKAFANRLLHLGFNVAVIGEITSPRAKEGDLLLIASNSGETASLLNQVEIAKKNKLKIVTITGNCESSLAKIANIVVNIPLGDQVKELSVQPMGSLFEQSTLLLCDSIVLTFMEQKQETEVSMRARHSDIE